MPVKFLKLLVGCAALIVGSNAPAVPPPTMPPSIYTDPEKNSAFPAAIRVLHIQSGEVQVNGLAYIPSGPGPHPVLILFHGLPGNEKNLDLAQTARRAGWTVVTLNYRGSWGSPGSFEFASALEDAKAAIAYVRASNNAKDLRADPAHIVLAGHSMGGWVVALTAAQDAGLSGAILISASNMGDRRAPDGHRYNRAELVADMAKNMESLNGTTPERMADELLTRRARFDWTTASKGLSKLPVLVLTSNDGRQTQAATLAAAILNAGGRVSMVHVATDHSWSDSRVRLQAEVIRWLEATKALPLSISRAPKPVCPPKNNATLAGVC